MDTARIKKAKCQGGRGKGRKNTEEKIASQTSKQRRESKTLAAMRCKHLSPITTLRSYPPM